MMVFEIDGYNALKAALRRMCDQFSAEEVPEETVFDSKLVAGELVTNALRYGGGSAMLKAEKRGSEIRIAVRGANEFCPPEDSACSDPLSERGRGLFLVDSLSLSRRYSPEEGICVVLSIRS